MTPTPDDYRSRMAQARHDLRTPVNAIMGYSEMLLEELADHPDPAFQEGLEQIHRLGRQILSDIPKLLGDDVEPSKEDISISRKCHSLLMPSRLIVEQCQQLLDQTDSPAHAICQDDLGKIYKASQRLSELIHGSPIPEDTPTGQKPTTAVESLPRQPAQGHVLITDDNELNRDMIARHLTKEGLSYEMARDGQEALNLAEKGNFDLVLLDIMMTGMDGIEVLGRLKAHPKLNHIPVIMISALDEIDSVVRCIEMGAEDYLPKPFDAVLLRARVGACLEKKHMRDHELDYLENVEKVTSAAADMEAGRFEEDSIEAVTKRDDPLGQLARVFVSMARQVKTREKRLKKQVQLLRIEIDEVRKQQQVADVTESQYFQLLQDKAKDLKNRRHKP